jgi:hypothetical protein
VHRYLFADTELIDRLYSGVTDGSRMKKHDEMDENRRNCVICTVESRQIICWPCRYVSSSSLVGETKLTDLT